MRVIASDAAAAHKGREPAGEIAHSRRLTILLDPGHRGSLVGRQGRDGLHQQPRELLGRGQRRSPARPGVRGRDPSQPLAGRSVGRRRAALGDEAVNLTMGAHKALVAHLAPERHDVLAPLGHALFQVGQVRIEPARVGRRMARSGKLSA